jgi:hypothetical protein
MDRRQALQLLATGAALQLAPARMFAALREARAALGTQAALRTLNPHQQATLTAIADAIIPRTDTPSASEVGVIQFADLILTEWYTEPERKKFLDGLEDVDARAQGLFGRKFTDCAIHQQGQVLDDLGEQMMRDAEAVRNNARPYRGSLPEPEDNFYYRVRTLVLTGYYTSESGATQELNFKIIPDTHAGCAAAPDSVTEPVPNQ